MSRRLLNRFTVPYGLCTPGGLLRRAVLVAAAFGVCHLAGWREHTSILSGTDPSLGEMGLRMYLGFVYLMAFLGVTVIAPILALGALILELLNLYSAWRATVRVRRG